MMKRKALFLLVFLFNIALFKKEIDLDLKNTILNYYNERDGDLNELDIETFKNLEKIKFESFKFSNNKVIQKAKMIVQKTGKYKINCEKTTIWLFDEEGKLISNFKENDKVYLLKNNIIYAQFLPQGSSEIIKVNIEYLDAYNLPFNPINIKNESEFDTSSVTYDPLKSSEIKFKQSRSDFRRIYK